MNLRLHRIFVCMCVVALLLGAEAMLAQSTTPTPPVELTPEAQATEAALPLRGDFIAQVAVDSVYARTLPTTDSPTSASLFENEWVEVAGRNLDGQWYLVRRPFRVNTLGWVQAEHLDWDFRPERLPLADFTTGVTGNQPLTRAEPFGVYLIEAPIVRAQPTRTGARVGVLPPLTVVPALARNQDGSWLLINYFGLQGWINSSSTRHEIDLTALYEPSNLPPLDSVPVIYIPLEVQQAQVDRMRTFITERLSLAADLEGFWWSVYRGETLPCAAPAQVSYYPYTEADVRELPELQRYAPQLAQAVQYLAIARAPILNCGVVAPQTAVDARNAAINARVVLEATLDRLNRLETNVVQYGR